MLIKQTINKNFCQIISNKEDFEKLRFNFSVFNKASKFSKSKYVNDRKYTITPLGVTRIGMIPYYERFAKENNINFDLCDDLKNSLYVENDIELKNLSNINYYSYQNDGIKKLLKKGHGICLLGTGGGKTVISSGIIESFYKKINSGFRCLYIVDGISMVSQTINKFKQYGVSFTFGEWDKNDPLIKYNCYVVNIQYLTRNIKQSKQLFKNIDLLIFDEVHHVQSGNKITSLLDYIKTRHKYGFTGTLPLDQFEKWLIIGIFGGIVFEKSSFDLRYEGKLTNTFVKILKIKYKSPPFFNFQKSKDKYGNSILIDSTEIYDKEYNWIYNNDFRNDIIKKFCINFNNNILILVNSLSYLDILFKHISSLKDKKIRIIKGEIKDEERKKIFKELEQNNDMICIAMCSVFSTGIDVSNIHMIIFAAMGKSYIRTIQSIGRGIRLNNNKNKLLVIDIADDLKYGNLHLQERKKSYVLERYPYEEIIINE